MTNVHISYEVYTNAAFVLVVNALQSHTYNFELDP